MAMLLWGEAAIVLSEVCMYHTPPPAPLANWVDGMSSGVVSACAHATTERARRWAARRGCAHAASALVHARFALSGLPLLIILQLVLTPLLIGHLYLAACNVTTREHMHWISQAPGVRGGISSLPVPGTKRWLSYAPFDRGIWRNVVAFVRGARDPKVEWILDASAADDDEPASCLKRAQTCPV